MVAHFGQTAESLVRLRGPIGICIGSMTPPEIAVSMMAEILAVKDAWCCRGRLKWVWLRRPWDECVFKRFLIGRFCKLLPNVSARSI